MTAELRQPMYNDIGLAALMSDEGSSTKLDAVLAKMAADTDYTRAADRRMSKHLVWHERRTSSSPAWPVTEFAPAIGCQ